VCHVRILPCALSVIRMYTSQLLHLVRLMSLHTFCLKRRFRIHLCPMCTTLITLLYASQVHDIHPIHAFLVVPATKPSDHQPHHPVARFSVDSQDQSKCKWDPLVCMLVPHSELNSEVLRRRSLIVKPSVVIDNGSDTLFLLLASS
jgi:hypothetical protein